MSAFQSVTAVTIAGAFVFGMVLVLLGSIRLLLAKRFDLSEGRVDWLVSALNLSLIPMMLVSGMVIDRLGVKNVLLVGSLLTALAVWMLAISTTSLRALGSILLAGVGGACLSTGSIVLMRAAFFTNIEAASQNLGNVFFGLGALATPTLAEFLIERLGYRRALSLLAVLCLLPALLAALTAGGAFEEPKAANLETVFRRPVLWLTGLVLFLYVPLEGLLGNWATRYLTDRGFGARWAEWLLAGFWLSFLASRLGAAFLQWRVLPEHSSEAWLIVVLALAAAVSLGNLAGARTRFSAAAGCLLVGAFFGPIFPTLVGILFDYFKAERGTAYGAMFAIGAIGNLFLLPLIGIYARRSTIQRAMRIPLVMALLIALVALVLALARPLLVS